MDTFWLINNTVGKKKDPRQSTADDAAPKMMLNGVEMGIEVPGNVYRPGTIVGLTGQALVPGLQMEASENASEPTMQLQEGYHY